MKKITVVYTDDYGAPSIVRLEIINMRSDTIIKALKELQNSKFDYFCSIVAMFDGHIDDLEFQE